jgi:hypothetical protein
MVVPTWATDPLSMKAVPASSAEWTQLVQAYQVGLPVPDHLWLMQETAGALGDSIGSVMLTPQNSPSYANPVAGWTRSAVGTQNTLGNQGFISSAAGNLNGTSHLLLVYGALVAPPSSDRSLAGIGAGFDHRYIAITNAPAFQAAGAGVVATTGTLPPGTTVHPLVLVVNAAASTYTVYTDQEKLATTWTPTSGSGGLVMIGNAIVGTAAARYLYGALWAGPEAQVDDAMVKRLLQSMGWTVSGY